MGFCPPQLKCKHLNTTQPEPCSSTRTPTLRRSAARAAQNRAVTRAKRAAPASPHVCRGGQCQRVMMQSTGQSLQQGSGEYRSSKGLHLRFSPLVSSTTATSVWLCCNIGPCISSGGAATVTAVLEELRFVCACHVCRMLLAQTSTHTHRKHGGRKPQNGQGVTVVNNSKVHEEA